MAAGVYAFNVAVPGSGAATAMESEAAEGAYEGGQIWFRNSGTVNLLLGGNDAACVAPLNTTDPWLGPFMVNGPDAFFAKIATGSSAGQLTVLVENK